MAVKDGCAPQGQCGCCTVLVDGDARVACVTPAARIAGRAVTTVDGLAAGERDRLAARVRRDRRLAVRVLHARDRRAGGGAGGEGHDATPVDIDRALAAHLCRCTGWRTSSKRSTRPPAQSRSPHASPDAAARRAELEGGVAAARRHRGHRSGDGGFADDTRAARRAGRGAAPARERGAERGGRGRAVGRGRVAARGARARGQGAGPADDGRRRARRSRSRRCPTAACAWRRAGSSPATSNPTRRGASPAASRRRPLANGGAFGGKAASPVAGGRPRARRPTGRAGAHALLPGGRRPPRPEATADRGERRRCATGSMRRRGRRAPVT